MPGWKCIGYNGTNINEIGENLAKYDIIVNTVPKQILTKENLKYIKKDALIIDLASKPGGVDFEEAKRLGLNYEFAQALPGKISPVSSAEYIKRIIDKL